MTSSVALLTERSQCYGRRAWRSQVVVHEFLTAMVGAILGVLLGGLVGTLCGILCILVLPPHKRASISSLAQDLGANRSEASEPACPVTKGKAKKQSVAA